MDDDVVELDIAKDGTVHMVLDDDETVESPDVEMVSKILDKKDKPRSVIEDLLYRRFYNRTKDEQRAIVKAGRPCPDLNDLKSLHKEKFSQYTRTFNSVQYESCDWLTGCEVQKKLYCWPCLLYTKAAGMWNFGGFSNLNNIHSSQRKHKISVSHLQSVLQLKKFRESFETSGDTSTSNPTTISNFEHNVMVRKNLDLLKKMTDIMFMFIVQDIPFYNDVDSARFKTMLDYFVKDEPALEARLNDSSTFADIGSIRDDLLFAMTEVVYDEISKEIEKSFHVALMFDEVRDAHLDTRLSTIIRYVYNNNVYERFLGFTDLDGDRTVERVLSYVHDLIKRLKINGKIVAQTYNGASSLKIDFDDFQKRLRATNPNAHFVNCYAHILNDVLSNSLLHIKECEVFFNTLNEIAAFSVHANGTTETLIEYLGTKVPSLAEGDWNFNSCLVYHINVHRLDVVEFFQNVIETEEIVDSKERMSAIGILKFLKQFRTIFLLNLFSTIFNSSHKLFEMTQSDSMENTECKEKAQKFLNDLKNLRENGFLILWDFVTERTQPRTKEKKICFGLYEGKGDAEQVKCKEIFEKVTSIVSKQTEMRFSTLDQFVFFDLLNSKRLKPPNARARVSDELTKSLNNTYPGMLDMFQVRNEIGVLYNHTDFGNFKGLLSPSEKLKWLVKKNLSTTFEAVYKLAALMMTIPMLTDSISFSDSCLSKVQKYFRTSKKVDRLSDKYSSLLIAKPFLNELKTTRGFYDKVVAKFITLKKNSDFQFEAGTFYTI